MPIELSMGFNFFRMNKKIFLVFYLVFYTSLYSQNKQIEAVYEVTFLPYENNDSEGAKYYNSILKSQNRFLNNIRFKLIANKRESRFEGIEVLLKDSKASDMMAINSSNFNNTYYTNIFKNYFQVNYNNKAFNIVVQDSLKEINWKISKNKYKLINGCNCLHASAKIEINLVEKNVNDIDAFFCPDVNFKFGPLNYFGLPGLIYELKENNVVYTISDLKIDKYDDIKSYKIESEKYFNKIEFENIVKQKIISTFGESALDKN